MISRTLYTLMYLELHPLKICAAVALLPSAGSSENIVSVARGSLQWLTLAAGNCDFKCLQKGM